MGLRMFHVSICSLCATSMSFCPRWLSHINIHPTMVGYADPTITPSSAGTCPAASNTETTQVSRSLSRASLGTGTQTEMGTMKMTTMKITSHLPIPAIVHRDAAGSAQRCTRFSPRANTSRCSANCKGWLMCRYHLSCLCRVTSLPSPTSTGGPDTSSAAGSTAETPARVQVLPPLLRLFATTG